MYWNRRDIEFTPRPNPTSRDSFIDSYYNSPPTWRRTPDESSPNDNPNLSPLETRKKKRRSRTFTGIPPRDSDDIKMHEFNMTSTFSRVQELMNYQNHAEYKSGPIMQDLIHNPVTLGTGSRNLRRCARTKSDTDVFFASNERTEENYDNVVHYENGDIQQLERNEEFDQNNEPAEPELLLDPERGILYGSKYKNEYEKFVHGNLPPDKSPPNLTYDAIHQVIDGHENLPPDPKLTWMREPALRKNRPLVRPRLLRTLPTFTNTEAGEALKEFVESTGGIRGGWSESEHAEWLRVYENLSNARLSEYVDFVLKTYGTDSLPEWMAHLKWYLNFETLRFKFNEESRKWKKDQLKFKRSLHAIQQHQDVEQSQQLTNTQDVQQSQQQLPEKEDKEPNSLNLPIGSAHSLVLPNHSSFHNFPHVMQKNELKEYESKQWTVVVIERGERKLPRNHSLWTEKSDRGKPESFYYTPFQVMSIPQANRIPQLTQAPNPKQINAPSQRNVKSNKNGLPPLPPHAREKIMQRNHQRNENQLKKLQCLACVQMSIIPPKEMGNMRNSNFTLPSRDNGERNDLNLRLNLAIRNQNIDVEGGGERTRSRGNEINQHYQEIEK